MPDALVVVSRVKFVCCSLATTLASGIAAPLASATLPVMLPWSNCAWSRLTTAEPPKRARPIKIRNLNLTWKQRFIRHLFVIVPIDFVIVPIDYASIHPVGFFDTLFFPVKIRNLTTWLQVTYAGQRRPFRFACGSGTLSHRLD